MSTRGPLKLLPAIRTERVGVRPLTAIWLKLRKGSAAWQSFMTASAAMLNRASFHLVGFLSAEYDMHGPGAGTQLHIAHNSSQHLMISILGFGEASHVSGAAAQIARKAMRRL